MWIIDSRFEQKTIFSMQISHSIPRTLAFASDGSQNVLVFGLDNGNMQALCYTPELSFEFIRHIIDGRTGDAISVKSTGTIMYALLYYLRQIRDFVIGLRLL